MLIQPIKFTDFNGTKRDAELFFNLNEDEVIKLQIAYPKGLETELQKIADDGSQEDMYRFIEMLVKRSYGVKSDDGLHFRKTEEVYQDFFHSAMYSDFMLSLFKDGGQPGFDFIKGILPPSLVKSAMAKMEGTEAEVALSAREQFEARNRRQNAQTARVVDFTEQEEAPVEPTQKSADDYKVGSKLNSGVKEEPTEARTGNEPQRSIFGQAEPEVGGQPSTPTQGEPSYEEFLAWQNARKQQDATQALTPDEDSIQFSRPIHQVNVQPTPEGENAPLRRRAIQDNPQA